MSNKISPPKPIILQISKCFIRPKHDEQRAHYHLVHTDISFLGTHYMQKGLLFIKPQHFNVQVFLDKLKNAISIALDYYYPLGGQFVSVKEDEDTCCWMYLDPNKGPGASFVYALCSDVNVDDVVKSNSEVVPIIRGFFELGDHDVVNYDGHTRTLLCVQVTELIDGVFIGFAMNHAVADGSTFWNFVTSLSEILNAIDGSNTNMEKLNLSKPPIIKHLPGDGCDPIIKLSYPKLTDFITKFRAKIDPNLSERIFHFSSLSLAKLKAQANAEFSKDNGSLGQISSFQSLTAFLWTSITRARNLDPDLATTCTIVADARARYDPPLTSNYFGNFIVPILLKKKVGELMQNGFAWVAMELHQGVKNIDKNLVRERCKSLFEYFFGPKPEIEAGVGGETAFVVGGSVRFNVYGSEFGLGKAIAVRTGYSAKTDGKVTTSPGREGDGSVEAEISLSSKVMCALEQDHHFMSFVTQN